MSTLRDRTYRTEGLVLRTATAREADVVVTLITPHHGRLTAVARGARKPSSRLVGHLEPLNRVDLHLARGRNLDIVTQAQVVYSFPRIKADLGSLTRALHMAELVEGFAVEGAPSQGLFTLLLRFLHLLEEDPSAPLTLPAFRWALLKEAGFMPRVNACALCGREPPEGKRAFSPHHGGLVCATCLPSGAPYTPLSRGALDLLRTLSASEATVMERPGADALREADRILTTCVRFWLERDPRTLSVMQRIGGSGVL